MVLYNPLSASASAPKPDEARACETESAIEEISASICALEWAAVVVIAACVPEF